MNSNWKKMLLSSVLLFFSSSLLGADIVDFTLRSSGNEGKTVMLVALDENGSRQNQLSGAYSFSVNGFDTDVRFNEGKAPVPREIDGSTFLYIKFQKDENKLTRLFYVMGGGSDLTVIPIPLMLLVIVPLALILIGMFFRRMLIIVALLLGAFFYFNSSRGLSFESFFDAVKEWFGTLLQLFGA